jgi:hypothetical protein
MQHFFMDETALKALIQAVPANHSLRTAWAEYRDAFASAFLAVYGNMADRDTLAVLKRKFLVSADSAFLEDTYPSCAGADPLFPATRF